jgi:hypothetical protein
LENNIITEQEQLLLVLQYPPFANCSIEEINDIINDYKKWLVEEIDLGVNDVGDDANSMAFLELYFECIAEDNDFIQQQMAGWEDDDVPGFR